MIYFVRHGETDGNNSGLARGKVFDDELNTFGIEQAKQTAKLLKDVKFDICYCSPLKRTRQTQAEIFTGKTIYDERLLPRDYGNLAGKDVKFMNDLSNWDRNLNKTEHGVERILDFEKRIFGLLDEMRTKHKGKNVLLVGHASVGRIARAYRDGVPQDGNYMRNREMLKNGEVLQIEN